MSSDRRHFIGSLATLTGTALLAEVPFAQAAALVKPFPISCNSYTWLTFYQRQGKIWMAPDFDTFPTDLLAAMEGKDG